MPLGEKPDETIRFGDWKAVRNGPDKAIELYDLNSNAGDSNDLAADDPDLVAKAAALMRQARVDDPNWPLVAKPKAKRKTEK